MADNDSATPPTEQHMLDFIADKACVDSETARVAYSGDRSGLHSLFNRVNESAKMVRNGAIAVLICGLVAGCNATDNKPLARFAGGLMVLFGIGCLQESRSMDAARETILTRYASNTGRPAP